MRSKRFIGMLTIFLGIFFLLPMILGGMRSRIHARAAYAHAHFEAAQQAQAESANSAETTNPHARHHDAYRAHHGYGPFGFIGGIFKLFFLGFMLMTLLKLFKRRHHHRHHRHRAEQSADDLTEEIRVGDEISRAEAATHASAPPMPRPEEMTVDDLVMAMKRLGIKKLEL